MGLLVFGSLVALVSLAGLVLLVLALIDLVKRPSEEWTASGHNQLLWGVIIVFVGFIGPLLYLLIARPALEAVRSQSITAGL